MKTMSRSVTMDSILHSISSSKWHYSEVFNHGDDGVGSNIYFPLFINGISLSREEKMEHLQHANLYYIIQSAFARKHLLNTIIALLR